jgi:hypothetical protein
MNTKPTFVDSGFDEATGESWVTVALNHQFYVGRSKLLEEDKDKASKYAGCRFAEMKAELKALKDLRRIEKEKCDECKRFVKALECYKEFDKESKTARCVYRQLNKRIRNVNYLTELINKKREDFLIAINQRDIVVKAIERKKAKES